MTCSNALICDCAHTSFFSLRFQLVLRHNRLRHVPKELARLPQLKELHIQQNYIHVLPPAFGKCAREFDEERNVVN